VSRAQAAVREVHHRRSVPVAGEDGGGLSRVIPKILSSTPIGDGNRFSDKIMRKPK
jgi:hypothetical protein